jgi:uncharacterized membrane protein HdeD (DUF308 family)
MELIHERIHTSRVRLTTSGVIAIILGMLAMLAPGLTGLSVLLLVGAFVLVTGIVRIIWAFQAGSFVKGAAGFVVGGLTFVAGILLIANPLIASGVLTVVLSLYFIIDGVFEITASVQHKPQDGWGWLMFGGVVSVILGVLLWTQYPLSGVMAMGILFGIKLFMIGLIMVMGGSVMHELEHGMEEKSKA